MKKGLSVIVNKTASITNTNNGKSLAAGKNNSSTLRVVLRKDEIDNSGTILHAPSSSRGSAEKEDPSNVKSNASKKCKRYRNRYLKILNIYAKIFFIFPLLNIHCSLHPLLLFYFIEKKKMWKHQRLHQKRTLKCCRSIAEPNQVAFQVLRYFSFIHHCLENIYIS